MAGNSVSCNNGIGHTDNTYMRVFNLADFGILTDLNTTMVQVGIESATGAGGQQPATVNIYTLSGPLVWANLTLIGTVDTVVSDQALTIIDVPIATTVPAGSEMVVEFFTPDGQATSTLLWVGSNNLGQTGPTYLAAAGCGIVEPTDTAVIGFPGMHLVMNVAGETGPAAPDTVEVTFDVTVTAECGDIVNTAELDYNGIMASGDHTVSLPPCCEPVTGVDLSVLNAGPIYAGDIVDFEADIVPDGFTPPYNYSIDFGDLTPPETGSGSDDPFTTDYAYTAPGTYTVEIEVWNCDVAEAVTDALDVVVMEPPAEYFYIYLPIVKR
jgi:hypothetical protein